MGMNTRKLRDRLSGRPTFMAALSVASAWLVTSFDCWQARREACTCGAFVTRRRAFSHTPGRALDSSPRRRSRSRRSRSGLARLRLPPPPGRAAALPGPAAAQTHSTGNTSRQHKIENEHWLRLGVDVCSVALRQGTPVFHDLCANERTTCSARLHGTHCSVDWHIIFAVLLPRRGDRCSGNKRRHIRQGALSIGPLHMQLVGDVVCNGERGRR